MASESIAHSAFDLMGYWLRAPGEGGGGGHAQMVSFRG